MSTNSGLATGPSLIAEYQNVTEDLITGASETSNAPFVVRLVVPDALLQGAESEVSVDLLNAAARGLDKNKVGAAVSRSTAFGSSRAALNTFVSGGKILKGLPGFNSAIADAYTAADISVQVQKILDCPPLTLLVNPSEMSIAYTKIQSYQSKTRYGYVFEAWGEELPTISFSGSTAGFVTPSRGYSFKSMPDSAAWQNFSTLVQMYKNNGYIYDTIGKSYAHLFVGSVAIDYDQWTYVGNIESFSYTIDEGMFCRVQFEMEFKVTKMYDTSVSSNTVGLLHPPGTTTRTFSSDTSDLGYDSMVAYSQPPLEDWG